MVPSRGLRNLVDPLLPTRARLVTLRERITHSWSFHLHRGAPGDDHAGRATATHDVGRLQPFRPPGRGYPLGGFGGFARIPRCRPLSSSAEQRPLRLASPPPLLLLFVLG